MRTVPSDFKSKTFEHIVVSDPVRKITYIVIYRPDPSPPSSQFLTEFDEFQLHTNTFSGKLIMLGDFNVHVKTPNKSGISQFLTSVREAGFQQHVIGPTHIHGNTLDLILSRPEDELVSNNFLCRRSSVYTGTL